jgi:hypothetical protein
MYCEYNCGYECVYMCDLRVYGKVAIFTQIVNQYKMSDTKLSFNKHQLMLIFLS